MKKKGARRKPSMKGKIFLAVITCVNLGLSVALSLLRRQEVLHAVEKDGAVQVLALGREKTK